MRLKVKGWDTGLRFSAAHFIPSHDRCSRLHGHDYAIDITVEGSEDGGFIIDFDLLKQKASEVLYSMDHRVLVPLGQEIVKHTEDGKNIHIEYNGKTFSLAKEDVFFVPCSITSSEQMVEAVLDRLVEKIGPSKNIRRIEVCLFEGPGQGACSSRDFNE